MTTLQLATQLRDTYDVHCAFPKWVLEPSRLSLCIQTMVLYPHDTDIDTIIRLATEREPVNMTMTRLYDQTKMETYFGFQAGYYGTHFQKHRTLAPNIAIYVYTPIY